MGDEIVSADADILGVQALDRHRARLVERLDEPAVEVATPYIKREGARGRSSMRGVMASGALSVAL